MADSLPPVADGGYGWFVMLGAFIAGLIYSASIPLVGIYLVYWNDFFKAGAGATSIIATELNIGLLFMGVAGALCKRYGCRPVMLAGGFLAFSSTLIASFATELWHLYIYGVLAGIGHGFSGMVPLVIIRYYFNKRMGLANGVLSAGMSAGILTLAPVIDWMCANYGWQGALRVHSAIIANYFVCGALFRPSKLEHLVVYQSRHHARPHDPETNLNANSVETSKFVEYRNMMCCRIGKGIKSWLHHLVHHTFALPTLIKNRLYVMLTVTAFFMLWGYVTTVVFLMPKLVYDMGISKMKASLVMTVYGVSGLIARLLHGFLLDHHIISVCNLYLLSLLICGITPAFSPLIPSIIGQFIIVSLFGISSGVVQAVLFLLCREYVTVEQAPVALGNTILVGGSGILIGTYVNGKLYDVTGSFDIAFYANGAMIWLCFLVVLICTKCTSWRPPHLVQNVQTKELEHKQNIPVNGVAVANSSHNKDEQPIPKGYQIIHDTEVDSSNGADGNCAMNSNESRGDRTGPIRSGYQLIVEPDDKPDDGEPDCINLPNSSRDTKEEPFISPDKPICKSDV